MLNEFYKIDHASPLCGVPDAATGRDAVRGCSVLTLTFRPACLADTEIFGTGWTHVSLLVQEGRLREVVAELDRTADEAEAFERRMNGGRDVDSGLRNHGGAVNGVADGTAASTASSG
jgi:hypothetical protein